MATRCAICVALFFFVVAMFSGAQEQKSKEVKRAPAPITSAASGKDMFVSYCASCHGTDGKGNGPAASALSVAPADLTGLARKNGGKYPDMRVTTVLRGQANLAAHGNKEMPVWGPVFFRMSGGHESEVTQRISNLNHYIETLQAK